ncbi:MAG: tetratricopeptide repeat protein [Cyanobacteria bacterium J06621_11]
MTESEQSLFNQRMVQKAFDNVSARDITANIRQEIHNYPVPREKPIGIPNNSPNETGKFFGRTQALKDLHVQLAENPSGVVAIVGMAGLGKSELALQYARQYQDTYAGGICWLNAHAGDLLTNLIQYCQLQLGMMLPQELSRKSLSVADMAIWYITNWRLEGDVLVVLDDVVKLSDCKPLLDVLTSRFRKLITTRNQILDASFFQLPLEVLHPDDAMGLLTALAGERIQAEETIAEALCETLGYLPLGIELVGRYLFVNPFSSVAEVSQNLSLRSQQLDPQTMSMMANQRGIWAAFEASWDRLDKGVQQLAQLLSFFAPGDISWKLVEEIVAQTDFDDMDLISVRTELYQQSLLQRGDKFTLRLHPLTQKFFTAKRQQNLNQERIWQQSYIQGLLKFVSETSTVEDINLFASAIPHLTDLIERFPKEIPDEQICFLFSNVVDFYLRQIIYAKARTWAEQGMIVVKERLGEEHFLFARSLNSLASVYQAQGYYKDAKTLCLKALEINRHSLGDDHPIVATNLNNLSVICGILGSYEDAEAFSLKALKTFKSILGENHPEIAYLLNNLAIQYIEQGNYAEAESSLLKAIDIGTSDLGEEHPANITRISNLASLYLAQNRYDDAESYYLDILEITKRTLGDSHPRVAMCLNNIGTLYYQQGRYDDAEPFLLEALTVGFASLGENHPEVAKSLNNLGNIYFAKERYDDAEPLLIESLKITKEYVGKEHAYTAKMLNSIANLYSLQKRYGEAENYFLEALSILKGFEASTVTLGNPRIEFAKNLNELAVLYSNQDRFTEAESLLVEATDIGIDLLGEDHPSTSVWLKNLSTVRLNAFFMQVKQKDLAFWYPLYSVAIVLYVSIDFSMNQNPKIFYLLSVILLLWTPYLLSLRR